MPASQTKTCADIKYRQAGLKRAHVVPKKSVRYNQVPARFFGQKKTTEIKMGHFYFKI